MAVRVVVGFVIAAAVGGIVACNSGSPAEPTPPAAGGSGPGYSGRTVDVITGAPIAGVTLEVSGAGAVVSDSAGTFTVGGDSQARRAVKASSPQTVERSTYLPIPDAEARLSLIPSSFDLAAFDAMFRSGGDGILRRWVNAPSLVVERAALRFTRTGAPSYTATGDLMSPSEANRLVEDLQWALEQLSGGTFTAFANVRVESTPAGSTVQTQHAGAVFVARYEGLARTTNFDGYTGWSWSGAGHMVRASMMLDRDYDATAPSLSRRALRAHEMGHALGWMHLETRTSVMNPRNPTLPTDFDRMGATIAFNRLPLNRTPDIDVAPASAKQLDNRIYSFGDY